MFEQATLTSGPAGARAWTTFLGLSSQIALVSLAVLAPMVWPQMLPTAHILEILAPPLPPGPAPRPLGGEVKLRPSRPGMVKFHHGLYMPTIIPNSPIPIIDDEPTGPQIVGIPLGMGGPGGGIPGGILSALENAVPVVPPPVVRPAPKPADVAPAIPRLRQGGDVHLGALLHKAAPQYPSLAKAAHV